MYKKLIASTLIIATTLSLAGCGTRMSFSAAERAKIRNVQVRRQTPIPTKIIYYGASRHAADTLLGPLAGDIVSSGESQKYIRQIKAVMRKNHINVGTITRGAFLKKLHKSRLFTFDPKRPTEGTFTLNVTGYGLFEKGILFSKRMEPALIVQAKLLDSQHKMVWADLASINKFNSRTRSYTVAQYTKNPALLRRVFQQAAEQAAAKLIRNLRTS